VDCGEPVASKLGSYGATHPASVITIPTVGAELATAPLPAS
jgi:hypothetical protein